MSETNDSTHPVSKEITTREKFEQERLSRRTALRKIGMTTGMALFGMFAVDDLARISLSALKQHKETQAIAQTVAKELRSSGIAFADAGDDSPSPNYLLNAEDTGKGLGATCANRATTANCQACLRSSCQTKYPPIAGIIPTKRYTLCYGGGEPFCAGKP